LGLLITLVGAIATYGATILLKDSNPYEVAGVYTGALTSSPGLGAALETARKHSSENIYDYKKKTVLHKKGCY
jgi:putative transport protein